jgi:DNA-binding IclR family transcriptional regulator
MGKTPTGKDADRYLVPGLVRGLEALQAFAPERPRLTLGDLAAAAGVTRSAMFRIAYTLSQLAFLVHDPQGRFYTLGPAVLRLGYGYRSSRDLIAETLPQLEALRDATEWSAHLGVLEGTEVVYLLRVPARQGLAGIVHVGSRLPAHATSMGRTLLAQLSRAELITRYQDAQLIGVGPRTPTTVSTLLAQARRDFSRGYVIHMGEFEQGVASVSAPLKDVTGSVVAAINVAGPLARASDSRMLDPIVQSVLESASAISRGLGFEADHQAS